MGQILSQYDCFTYIKTKLPAQFPDPHPTPILYSPKLAEPQPFPEKQKIVTKIHALTATTPKNKKSSKLS